MKKPFTLIIFYLFASMLFGQINDVELGGREANPHEAIDDFNRYYDNTHDKQKIKDLNIRFIKVVVSFQDFVILKYFHFNEAGNLASTTTADSNGDTTESSVLKYDDDNCLIERRTSGSRHEYKQTFVYNKRNLLIEANWYVDDKFDRKKTYSYRHGKIDMFTFYEKQNLVSTTKCVYAKNNLIEIRAKDEDNVRIIKYVYNNQGLLDSIVVLVTDLDASTEPTKLFSTKYIYDGKRNIISMSSLGNNSRTDYYYNYNESDQLIHFKTSSKTQDYSYQNSLLFEKTSIERSHGVTIATKETYYYVN